MNTKHQPLDLSTLSMTTLVRIVNELGGVATMKTFSQRSKAVERVLKLAEAKQVNLDEMYDADGSARLVADELVLSEAPAPAEQPVPVELPTPEEPKPAEQPVPEVPAPVEQPAPAAAKKPSIRSFAEALILEITGKNKDGRNEGHSYATILDKVKEEYPNAKTSIACLRWYAVHMRERGDLPPSRPRAVPVKAVAAADEQKPEV